MFSDDVLFWCHAVRHSEDVVEIQMIGVGIAGLLGSAYWHPQAVGAFFGWKMEISL